MSCCINVDPIRFPFEMSKQSETLRVSVPFNYLRKFRLINYSHSLNRNSGLNNYLYLRGIDWCFMATQLMCTAKRSKLFKYSDVQNDCILFQLNCVVLLLNESWNLFVDIRNSPIITMFLVVEYTAMRVHCTLYRHHKNVANVARIAPKIFVSIRLIVFLLIEALLLHLTDLN